MGDSPAQDDVDEADFPAWQQKVKGTNISETTLLATDYLNHFNEIIMLLGMVPDMPEILEDCQGWAPKSYPDHFRDSGFSDKELAIAAYDHVPVRYRRPFDETIEQINVTVATAITQLGSAAERGDDGAVAIKTKTYVQALQKLTEMTSAIIHGAQHTMSQEEIDNLVGD